MNDSDQAPDVSLETDRLEQLLEVPAPAQPVVMIEYRNRGVPWWVLVPLVVVLPVSAVLYYRHAVLENYRELISKDAYMLKKQALEKAAEDPPAPETAKSPVVAAESPRGSAPEAILAAVSVPAEVAKAAESPPVTPETSGPAGGSKGGSEIIVTGAPEPSKARVRSILPGPIESTDIVSVPKGSGGDASARKNPASESAAVLGSPTTKIGTAEKQAGVAVATAAGKADTPERSPAAKAAGPSAGDREKTVRLEPLPSRDEWMSQLAQESARKNAEMAEEQEARNERMRARLHDDRVKFHEELRQILAANSKTIGDEIDDLAKRHRGDRDPRTYAKARGLWRNPRLPMPARANQLRSLDLSESDILNFISDNLVAHMHSPRGVKDANDLRARAARLLLSCPLPDAAESAVVAPGARTMVKTRATGNSRQE